MTLIELLSDVFNKEKDLIIECELVNLVKVEDWYKDGTTFKKMLRKGKGKQPNIDSNVFSKYTMDFIVFSED